MGKAENLSNHGLVCVSLSRREGEGTKSALPSLTPSLSE